MTTSYRVTGYDVDHRDALVGFQKLLWGSDLERNAAYLDWKYHQNPYLDHRYLTLAWDDDRIVGMVGAFGASWQDADSNRTLMPCLADAVVTHEHRGGTLFRAMVENLTERMKRDGLPWLLDFGNGLAAPALVLHGWRRIGPWPIVTAPSRSAPSPSAVWHEIPHHVGPRSGVTLTASDAVDPGAMADAARLYDHDRSRRRHVYDAEYLSWWHRNPMSRRFCLTAETPKLAGYLVAQRPIDTTDTCSDTTILDCVAASDALWIDLMDHAAAHLPGPRVLMWLRDCDPARVDALDRLGFAVQRPTGRVTKDWALPDMLIQHTGARTTEDAGIFDPTAWNLRAVCGRSWR